MEQIAEVNNANITNLSNFTGRQTDMGNGAHIRNWSDYVNDAHIED